MEAYTKTLKSCLECPARGVRRDTVDPARMYHCTLTEYLLCDTIFVPSACPLRRKPLLLTVDEADVRKS